MEKHFTKEVKAKVQQQQPLRYSAAAEKKQNNYFIEDEWTTGMGILSLSTFLAFLDLDRKHKVKKRRRKKCCTPLFISALLIIVDEYMKIHHVLKKQVTVKFYQAINFTCNAEEPICHHSGNQKTGTEACAPFFCF